MRILLFAGAAAISMATLPATLNAQSADQLNGASTPAPATTTAIVSDDPAQPDTFVTQMPGNMHSVPDTVTGKTYPVCTAKLQDNCQNRGEGGAPGRSRALNHWPGRPASEM